MKRIVLTLAFVVAGCSAPAATPVPTPVPTPAASPVTHTVTGTLTLNTSPSWTLLLPGQGPGQCLGKGGYSDIADGASVTLRDEKGTILGAASLREGMLAGAGCNFPFTLTDVPDTATFYAVTISHRGEISKSHAEMVADGWVFGLTLGT